MLERLARLEALVPSLEETVQRNHQDALAWRAETTTKLEHIDTKLDEFIERVDGLLNQAKGARWLAGLVLGTIGFILAVGIKEIISWFLDR